MNSDYLLQPNQVYIWWANLSNFNTHLDTCSKLLSKQELQRAARFRFEVHQQKFILSHAILRILIASYTNTKIENLEFQMGENGKPFLPNDLLQFNLAHSGNLAVYAFRTGIEVGIDIEKIEIKNHDKLAKKVFNNVEYEFFMKLSSSEKIHYFYRVWTAKEALIKAKGKGIFLSSTIPTLDANSETQTINWSDLYYLRFFSTTEGYQAAIATPLPIERIIYKEWTHDHLINKM